MSGSTSGSEVAGDVNLSPEAIALLEFTTDRDRPGTDSREPAYITSKDAFLWAGFAISIVKSAEERIEDIELLASLYDAVRLHHQAVRASFAALPSLEFQRPTPTNPSSLKPRLGRGSDICSIVISSFVQDLLFRKHMSPRRLLNEELINSAIPYGYNELLEKDLITDPILEGGLAILGFVPFSIVKKTTKGQAAYLRVRAALWSYERKRTTGGSTEIQLKWEIARIAKTLKVGIMSAFHEATKDGGDEPLPNR
jgi:hypothetical protein